MMPIDRKSEVPELTDPRDINVNPRLCLRAKANALASLGHTSWLSRNFAEAAGCSSPPGGFVFLSKRNHAIMKDRRKPVNATTNPAVPAWAELWHLWFVLIPRRSIAGKLVHGLVWRRYNGRRWIYKRFTEFQEVGNPE